MKWLLLPIISLALIFACGPSTCTQCNGSGKISSSRTEPLPFEVIKNSVVNNGFVNPDYFWHFKIKNKGDKAGTFSITCHYVYNDIGRKTVSGDLLIGPYQTEEITIRYDADKEADEFRYNITAPEVVVTDESICPACNGAGKK